jgi:CRP-like cAMP-binding protein
LLDRLPKEEYDRLVPILKTVSLAAEQDLYDVNDRIPHVYFPKSGMVSLVILLEDGRQVESGTIGNEGFVGLPVVLGFAFSAHRVVSQVPGESVRLAVGPFMEAVKRCPRLSSLLQRYVAVSLCTTAQIVACNALHPVAERLCRWLLMIHDRVATEAFPITQEFLAQMLGVRRQTVSIIAGSLQKAGLITYRRGIVRILNRKGIEDCTCECYAAMKASYDQIVG